MPGLHSLRIDEVDANGKVVARVESPFSRAQPVDVSAGNQVVVVQPGNSLWLIASRTYGSGFRYTVIYQANKGQISDPDLIYPGQVFKLPSGTTTQ
jgi:nucleoid-associated protein YgaU